MHRMRKAKTGTTDLRVRPTPTERFWAKVDKRGPDECWPWTGAHDYAGYGTFWSDLGFDRAIRFSFRLAGGVIPTGWCIDHLCENPPCVNPAHLEAVTNRENMLRRMRRRELPEAFGKRLPNGFAQSAVTDQLLAAGDTGARAEDIAATTGLALHTVYYHLRKTTGAHRSKGRWLLSR